MRNGRPLRFLVFMLVGWSGLRTMALWQAEVPPGTSMPLPLIGRAVANERFDPTRWLRSPGDHPPIAGWRVAPVVPATVPSMPSIAPRHAPMPASSSPALAIEALVRVGPAVDAPAQQGAITPPLRPTPIATARSRLAGSAWLIARGGGDASAGTLTGGQLGASQAGARLTYALGSGRRIALSARIATPIQGNGREAGLGFDWQPTRAPVHLIAEQRVSLDGGHGGPTILAVGGLNPRPVAAGFRIEGYAEAGAIARRAADGGVEGFGDGAVRLTRPVATLGRLRVDLGGGIWGAVQRGARRFDVGPTLGVVAPLGRKSMRLTLDWRQRIAGDARPGSGPALSVGTDF